MKRSRRGQRIPTPLPLALRQRADAPPPPRVTIDQVAISVGMVLGVIALLVALL